MEISEPPGTESPGNSPEVERTLAVGDGVKLLERKGVSGIRGG